MKEKKLLPGALVSFITLGKVMSRPRVDLESKTKWAENREEDAEKEMKLRWISCEANRRQWVCVVRNITVRKL